MFSRNSRMNRKRRVKRRIKPRRRRNNKQSSRRSQRNIVKRQLVPMYYVRSIQADGNGRYSFHKDILPFTELLESTYAPLWSIYLDARIDRIHSKVWITNVSATTTGRQASYFYREAPDSTTLISYQQLCIQPGSTKGRAQTVLNTFWRPIEPSDREFYRHGQETQGDQGQYGAVYCAGAGFPPNAKLEIQMELYISYTFRDLVKPIAPELTVTHYDFDDLPTTLESLNLKDPHSDEADTLEERIYLKRHPSCSDDSLSVISN